MNRALTYAILAAIVAGCIRFAMATSDPALPMATPGQVSDASPPLRFQRAGAHQLVIVPISEIGERCTGVMNLRPPPGVYYHGCTRRGVIYVPNPCAAKAEWFAGLLCHELAHANGWPDTHPR